MARFSILLILIAAAALGCGPTSTPEPSGTDAGPDCKSPEICGAPQIQRGPRRPALARNSAP